MPAKKEETKKKQTTQMSLQTEGEKAERQTLHKKSGLLFPVARVLKMMKKGRYADRISPLSAIGVAAVLEYMTAEILEMSGDNCFDAAGVKLSNKIQPRHICLAVKGDEEMSRAIGPDVIIPMGGVIPFIHEELENKKKSRKKNKIVEGMKDDQAAESDSEGSSTEGEEED